MALQSSGQISLANIAAEFGGAAPHSLSEYYGKDTVPSSGEITIGDFYGATDILYFGNGSSGAFSASSGNISSGQYTSVSISGTVSTTSSPLVVYCQGNLTISGTLNVRQGVSSGSTMSVVRPSGSSTTSPTSQFSSSYESAISAAGGTLVSVSGGGSG